MASLIFPLLLLAMPAGERPGDDFSAIVGTWEGESRCTVPNSPCRDEHVIYEIKAKAQKATISGYKVVKGEKLYMGDIVCTAPKNGTFHCSVDRPDKKIIDDWVFEAKAKTMDGTLYLDKERTIYRKIHVEKK